MEQAYIIGEVGSCHEGSLDVAKAMIRYVGDQEHTRGHWDNCELADANAVKFQFWSNGQKLAARRHAPEYADLYEKFRIPMDWLPLLRKEAKEYGKDFICTCYLLEDIAVIAPYVDRFKIASPDARDTKFIEAHLKYNKPILISTGLLTHEELMDVIRLRASYHQIKILHCVSAYPCPAEQVNLEVIRRYGLDGFSDHTRHPCMGALAYMAGARIMEAHVRRAQTSPDNPDYPHALYPEVWNAYVANIRIAELAHGDTLTCKETQPAEAPLRRFLA